jgi:hypothetical protein
MVMPLLQAKITLDHYISYLRHGLSTCYYCVSPMAFPEELQRKCIAHRRSPAPATGESAPTPRGAGAGAGDEDDEDRRDRDEGLSRPEKERTTTSGKSGDEKWEENLESKLKPLLGEVDVGEYGGRDIDE